MGMTRDEALKVWLPVIQMGVETMPECKEALDMAIKALEQEPFINKPCVSSGVCEHDKNAVLDKIRAEIIAKDSYVKSIRSDNRCFFLVEEVLDIIDKYRQEVRDKHGRYRVSN